MTSGPRLGRHGYGIARGMGRGSRARSGFLAIEVLARDVRLAVRRLVHRPGFWITSTLTLGLGVGMATAVAGLTDAVLFKPQPDVHAAERLIALYADERRTAAIDYAGIYYADYLGLHDAADIVDLAAFSRRPFVLTIDDVPSEVVGDLVSGSYFSLLGTRPVAGRLLEPADDHAGAPLTVVAGISIRHGARAPTGNRWRWYRGGSLASRASARGQRAIRGREQRRTDRWYRGGGHTGHRRDCGDVSGSPSRADGTDGCLAHRVVRARPAHGQLYLCDEYGC